MKQFSCLLKGVLLTPFFFSLFACGSKRPHWDYQQQKSLYSGFNSARMFLKSDDECNGVELEIVKGPTETRLYINIFSIPVPADFETENQVVVELTIEGYSEMIVVQRFQGGQRFLVEGTDTAKILSALANGQCVQIAIDRYKSMIYSEGFNQAYRRLSRLHS